ncbi:antA/AntB antirepressor family protein [Lentilactobacillus diolivorans]|uniref:antA/AntB antirepressor family protein n=1 Tax=Lentilactobacillus diolivorans TaxID=179838 RepID=UPI0024684042|nr:antA/AntB antirepressor family protein [Lentilactobacillus diolivorans]MDH5104649.1 antA/AntB antirepressor family protein [Lentilactobacillus diolivorans]
MIQMNELIKTFKQNDGSVAVDGRDLHDFLEVETPYTKWIDRMMEYGFAENVDFSVFDKNVHDDTAFGGVRKMKDHALTLDMAKELSMIQRTKKGKQARQYFISMEKQAKFKQQLPLPKDYPSALRALADSMEENQKLKPAADYTQKMLANPGLETTSMIAKNYGMSTAKFNQLLHKMGIQYRQGKTWLLYAKYQNCGYTHVEPFAYFDQKVGTKKVANTMKWTQLGQKFLYDFLASQHILPQVERLTLLKG